MNTLHVWCLGETGKPPESPETIGLFHALNTWKFGLTYVPMDWISSLEKRFGSWAIPNLAAYLIALQIVGVVLLMGGYADEPKLSLVGGLVMVGQWTRLLSFLMIPKMYVAPGYFPIWLLLVFFVFYWISSALEREWGTFRFNFFILCGYLFTVAAAFLFPTAQISCYYFYGSVFLAFATLFPNVEFLIFFLIPVKAKWLGWLSAVYYLLTLFGVVGGLGVPSNIVLGNRVAVAAVFANFALFFARDFMHAIVAGRRRQAFQARAVALEAQPRHECSICGATDKSDPSLHFRYCSTCGKCFCEKHIGTHEH